MAGTRVGIIGTGIIAGHHLRALANYPGGEVVAVFDVLPDRAQKAAAEFGIPTVCGSLDEMLSRKDIEAVIVATPPFAHMQPTIAALEAGKHVLCEKPFALDPNEAERMVRTAERTGRFLAVASARNRCSAAQRKAHEMIAAGELGDVYYTRWSRFRVRGRPGHHFFEESAWFLDKRRAGGGALIDIGVYQIDLVLWMLGYPKVVSVLSQIKQITSEPVPPHLTQDVDDHAIVMMVCENGAAALIETGWFSNISAINGQYILGTKAGLRFDPLTKVVGSDVRGTEGIMKTVEEPVLDVPDSDTSGFGNVTQQFVDAIAAGRQPWTPGWEALEVTRVIDAAYRSAAANRPVALV